MAHMGSRSGRRTKVSPPRDSATRNQRSGYVLLAVSGVVLATAFGGLASIIAPGDSPKVVPNGANSSSGAQLVPGDAAPGQTPVTVNGVALPAGSRTAMVTTNPDGTQVVTLLPAEGSDEAPIVLPPGTPLPPGTVIPPGTTLPPGTTTAPPRSDPPPSSSSPKPPSSSTPTSTPGTTSPTTGPTTSTGSTTSPPTGSTTPEDTSSSTGSDSSNPTTP